MIELFGRSSILNKLNPFKFLCYEVIDIFLMFDKQMNLWIVDINHTDEHLFYTLLFNKIFSINVYSNESIKKILSIYY